MTIYFPITAPISSDADAIIFALNSRALQLKHNIDSQSLLKRITLAGIKSLGLMTAVVAAASIPVTALLFSAVSLSIGAISLCLSITCLGIYMLMDPRSPGELIIRDQWKSVFESLRKGNGTVIIETCQNLAKQKEKRLSLFTQSLGTYPAGETTAFFHKACLVGYLQISMEHLRNQEDEEARSNAHRALSHFGASGYAADIKNFAQGITNAPKTMRLLMEAHPSGFDLHALDHFISVTAKKRNVLFENE